MQVCGGWVCSCVALCVHSQGKLPAPSYSSDLLSNPRKLTRPHHLHPLLASSFELLVGTWGYTSDLVHWIWAFLLEVENLIELAYFRVAPRGRYPSEPSCPRAPSKVEPQAPSRSCAVSHILGRDRTRPGRCSYLLWLLWRLRLWPEMVLPTTFGGCFQPSRAPIAAAFATNATLNVVVADRQFLDDPEFLPARRTAQIAVCTHRCQDSQTFGNRRGCRTPGTPLDLPMTLTDETPAPLPRR